MLFMQNTLQALSGGRWLFSLLNSCKSLHGNTRRVMYTRKGVLKKRQTITWSLPPIHLAFCVVLKGLHTQCRTYLTEGDKYSSLELN